MSINNVPHLTYLADQLTSVLFYLRNASQVYARDLLFHKSPDIDTLRAQSNDEYYWHDLVQRRIRHIEWYGKQPRPFSFAFGIDSAMTLYTRKRAEYEQDFPDQVMRLLTRPMPDKVKYIVYPNHDNYPSNEFDAFYQACFKETVRQVDAYRWMCEIDWVLSKYDGCDLMIPPQDTELEYDKGWESIEPFAHSLMRTLIANNSEQRRVRPILSEYGTSVTMKSLSTLCDNLGQWIRRSMQERREKSQ